MIRSAESEREYTIHGELIQGLRHGTQYTIEKRRESLHVALELVGFSEVLWIEIYIHDDDRDDDRVGSAAAAVSSLRTR